MSPFPFTSYYLKGIGITCKTSDTCGLELATPPKKKHRFVGFTREGCSRGGGNWGTLRIPKEDWEALGNMREDWGNHPL